jgi:hypothetical protein
MRTGSSEEAYAVVGDDLRMAERAPKRIDPMIDALRELWHRYPDLRLTQLIVNLTGKVAPDVFYFEDTLLEGQIRRWLESEPTKLDEPPEA